ncbi:hypothetical protein J8273_6684 [Carpediemonas membranifera]|uniref:Uncharacterized protein n=1 Tax=Carpediemonas membranifera TaxID=201153 RepID=A0A8J6E2M9_9EUKA|nr:hypothetical protein J8273_6684 [Carpediemonas membranifera]|eukprot:KAG9392092.1 hypothetical protein J8273_6684 [Carpediemonas membranifera]
MAELLAESIALADILTSNIPGNVPGVLRAAYVKLTDADAPELATDASQGDRSVTDLQGNLENICAQLPEFHAATSLVSSALVTLAHPPTSINIEGKLPDALHTLMQGTIWAIMKQQDPSAWFLCRKFAFVDTEASKSNNAFDFHDRKTSMHLSSYQGRVIDMKAHTRVPIPPALRFFYCAGKMALALTARGLYEFSGVDSYQRVSFANAPAIAALEDRLPLWRKHEAITNVWHDKSCTFVLSPGGLAAKGWNNHGKLGVVTESFKVEQFSAVPMPEGVSLDESTTITIAEFGVAIFTGKQCLVAGNNEYCQLGFDTNRQPQTQFKARPIAVDPGDQLQWQTVRTIQTHGGEVFISGQVRGLAIAACMEQSPVNILKTPTRVVFPMEVQSFGLFEDWVHGVFFARSTSGEMWVLGTNDHGQLGVPACDCVTEWTKVDVPVDVTGVFVNDDENDLRVYYVGPQYAARLAEGTVMPPEMPDTFAAGMGDGVVQVETVEYMRPVQFILVR